MHIDLWVAVAGLIVGFTVGLTGMGGGALMTPILVLFFHVQPLAAVSSDLVAAVVMKPVGGGVHLRRGTVNKKLVGWLCLGSVPSAFLGVVILNQLGNDTDIQDRLKFILGVALLVASASIVAKSVITARRNRRQGFHDGLVDANAVTIRPLLTVLIGIAGGLIVGMTSVGSGSLMIVLLLFLYPRLKASQLVGTDLVQAIPLVTAAALGHLLFGDFKLDITTSLLIGSIPGVYFGARVSTKAPDHLIRPALVFVLLASALKLLNVDTAVVGYVMGAIAVLGLGGYAAYRRWSSPNMVDQVGGSHGEVVEELALKGDG